MSGCGRDSVCNTAPPDPGYRRALWIAVEAVPEHSTEKT